MFKVNNKDTTTMPGIVLVSLLLTLNIFHLALVFLLLTLNMELPAGLIEKKVRLAKIGELCNKYFLKFSLHNHSGSWLAYMETEISNMAPALDKCR